MRVGLGLAIKISGVTSLKARATYADLPRVALSISHAFAVLADPANTELAVAAVRREEA